MLSTHESRFRRCASAAVAVLTVGLMSCNKGPTEPSASAFVRLQVVAPAEIAPGESVQLVATAEKRDGSVENVTTQTQWTAESFPTSSVLTLSGTGVAMGGDRGRSLVTARLGGLTGDATIFVIPKGTFRLTGKITDGGAGLENVTVTVISGVGEGLVVHTEASGQYELYGVAGSVQIRASDAGYFDRVQRVDVSANTSLTFELRPVNGPRGDLSGSYTLILTAGTCTSPFPEEGKRRVYAADVEQKGADLRVSLSGAMFWRGSGVFAGTVTPAGEIRFTIRPEFAWDYDAFDLIETLTSGTSLIVQGVITARSTPAGIYGTPIPNDSGNALHIRVNAPGGGWCLIDRFEMVPPAAAALGGWASTGSRDDTTDVDQLWSWNRHARMMSRSSH